LDVFKIHLIKLWKRFLKIVVTVYRQRNKNALAKAQRRKEGRWESRRSLGRRNRTSCAAGSVGCGISGTKAEESRTTPALGSAAFGPDGQAQAPIPHPVTDF
jgi:hypothetical protein